MLLPSPSLYRVRGALPHSFSGSQPTYAWKWVGISRKSVAAAAAAAAPHIPGKSASS